MCSPVKSAGCRSADDDRDLDYIPANLSFADHEDMEEKMDDVKEDQSRYKKVVYFISSPPCHFPVLM